jgi:protein TonB
LYRDIVMRGICWTTALIAIVGASASANAPFPPVQISGEITYQDYPSYAQRYSESGVVTAALVIDVNGNVSNCQISQSSGYKDLDDATCQIILRRFHFSPALGRDELPVASTILRSVRWVLPKATAVAPHVSMTDNASSLAYTLAIDPSLKPTKLVVVINLDATNYPVTCDMDSSAAGGKIASLRYCETLMKLSPEFHLAGGANGAHQVRMTYQIDVDRFSGRE